MTENAKAGDVEGAFDKKMSGVCALCTLSKSECRIMNYDNLVYKINKMSGVCALCTLSKSECRIMNDDNLVYKLNKSYVYYICDSFLLNEKLNYLQRTMTEYLAKYAKNTYLEVFYFSSYLNFLEFL